MLAFGTHGLLLKAYRMTCNSDRRTVSTKAPPSDLTSRATPASIGQRPGESSDAATLGKIDFVKASARLGAEAR
ncbi:hypothetical protein CTI14_00430 [Methylobacterium radiotolerans]|nr:hypothetical protein CTI14_00430 [Methylobacterium radiotolerans]